MKSTSIIWWNIYLSGMKSCRLYNTKDYNTQVTIKIKRKNDTNLFFSMVNHAWITSLILFDAIKYDKVNFTEIVMKKIIIFLTIPLLTSCATLKPVAPETPVTPIEQMSTYQLQNEYLEVEDKINELEREFNERKSSQPSVVNLDFTGNPAIWLVIALNAYNMNNTVTKIEKYRLRLSDITMELSKRGLYGPWMFWLFKLNMLTPQIYHLINRVMYVNGV